MLFRLAFGAKHIVFTIFQFDSDQNISQWISFKPLRTKISTRTCAQSIERQAYLESKLGKTVLTFSCTLTCKITHRAVSKKAQTDMKTESNIYIVYVDNQFACDRPTDARAPHVLKVWVSVCAFSCVPTSGATRMFSVGLCESVTWFWSWTCT